MAMPCCHWCTAGGLDAYVVEPSKAYSGAVVLITDVFGYKTDNIRRWADKLADAVSYRQPGKCYNQFFEVCWPNAR